MYLEHTFLVVYQQQIMVKLLLNFHSQISLVGVHIKSLNQPPICPTSIVH